ncbi:MAG: hypothetical protein R2867_36010 [Caldilineaceae bacterium]
MNANNKSKNQVKHILTIGTLCGLILATFLVLSLRDSNRVAAQGLSTVTAVTTANEHTSTSQSDLQSQLSALQAENQRLSADLAAAQTQVDQYQQQLVQAVQIIRQLQRQPQQAPAFR